MRPSDPIETIKRAINECKRILGNFEDYAKDCPENLPDVVTDSVTQYPRLVAAYNQVKKKVDEENITTGEVVILGQELYILLGDVKDKTEEVQKNFKKEKTNGKV